MKKFQKILGILLVFLLVGCTGQTQTTGEVTNERSDSVQLRAATVDLPGMYCFSCAISAKNTFKGMDGVKDASVDSDTKQGMVIYDATKITKEQLLQNKLIEVYEGKIIDDKPYS